MKAKIDIGSDPESWSNFINTLLEENIELLQNNNIPRFYKFKPKFREEKKEYFKNALQVIKDGKGDCEDLVAWRGAEIRLAGLPVYADLIQTGKNKYHAILVLNNKFYEDPSLNLLKMEKTKMLDNKIPYAIFKHPHDNKKYIGAVGLPALFGQQQTPGMLNLFSQSTNPQNALMQSMQQAMLANQMKNLNTMPTGMNLFGTQNNAMLNPFALQQQQNPLLALMQKQQTGGSNLGLLNMLMQNKNGGFNANGYANGQLNPLQSMMSGNNGQNSLMQQMLIQQMLGKSGMGGMGGMGGMNAMAMGGDPYSMAAMAVLQNPELLNQLGAGTAALGEGLGAGINSLFDQTYGAAGRGIWKGTKNVGNSIKNGFKKLKFW